MATCPKLHNWQVAKPGSKYRQDWNFLTWKQPEWEGRGRGGQVSWKGAESHMGFIKFDNLREVKGKREVLQKLQGWEQTLEATPPALNFQQFQESPLCL